jgi:hypothetical protein
MDEADTSTATPRPGAANRAHDNGPAPRGQAVVRGFKPERLGRADLEPSRLPGSQRNESGCVSTRRVVVAAFAGCAVKRDVALHVWRDGNPDFEVQIKLAQTFNKLTDCWSFAGRRPIQDLENTLRETDPWSESIENLDAEVSLVFAQISVVVDCFAQFDRVATNLSGT